MNPIKSILLLFLLLLINSFNVSKASDLVDFGALNKNVIVLHFDDGYVRYHQKGESRSNEWVISEPLRVMEAENLSNYQIVSEDRFLYVTTKSGSDKT